MTTSEKPETPTSAPPRPGPSARFIAVRWVVAIALLLLAGAAATFFSRSFVAETQSDTGGTH